MNLGYTISRNCLGLAEIPGAGEHPAIRWAFDLAGLPLAHDDTEAWCGSWQGLTAYLAGEPVPAYPARARSWLSVGLEIQLMDALEGDTLVLSRGGDQQPGPEVLDAQGHVGRLVSHDADLQEVRILAGNQGNRVSIASFPDSRILGIRRI